MSPALRNLLNSNNDCYVSLYQYFVPKLKKKEFCHLPKYHHPALRLSFIVEPINSNNDIYALNK